ncbi:MAG: hypothetical protein QX189_15220 [Methylococcales bacterium]
MIDIAIRTDHLSKCYHDYSNLHDSLRQFATPHLQRMTNLHTKKYFYEFWICNSVIFDTQKGKIVGLNGFGKSILLQLIYDILNPVGVLLLLKANDRVVTLTRFYLISKTIKRRTNVL